MSMDRHPSWSHPAARQLVAFAAGEAPTASAAAIAEHLAGCEECRLLVADLQGRDAADDPLLEAAWKGFQQRLSAARGVEQSTLGKPRSDPSTAGGASTVLPPAARGSAREGVDRAARHAVPRSVGPQRAPRVAGRPRLLAAAAALLLVASALLAWQLWRSTAERVEAEHRADRLAREVQELLRPHAALAEVSLFPRGALRQAGGTPQLVLAGGTRLVVLRLLLVEPAPVEGALRLVVRDRAGEPVAHLARVVPDADGHITVALPGDLLAPGPHTVELFAGAADGAGPVAQFPFQVVAEDRAP